MKINFEKSSNNFFNNEEMTSLLKKLSLDMTNTINGLSGFLELLNRRICTPVEQEFLLNAKYSTFNLTKQIEAFSTLVNEEQKVFPKCLTRINLHSLLTTALMFVRKQSFQRKINIDFEYDKNIPFILFCDSLKFSEIINLLLESATNFSKQSIKLSVSTLKSSSSSVVLRFELFYDGNNFDNFAVDDLFEHINNALSLQGDVNKLNLNLALANEFLKQCNSRLFYQPMNDNTAKLFFDFEFLANTFEDKN